MEVYLIIVIVLLLLASANLWVGVANDAVNFINSAIGSKAAPFKIVLGIAGAGMVAGVLFSSGMMEVAREGIFNPEMFYLRDVLTIFLAYAIGDILLLDLYNTFGLPTSTTVSLIFGLLGGSVAVSMLKISDAGLPFSELNNYINTAKVLSFVTAILLSIVFSFIFGSLVQYLSRLLFTFDYEKRLKRYGAVWGGLALTMITYFMIIKGIKGASFVSEDMVTYIKTHQMIIMGVSFAFWAVTLQLILWISKINILKIVVLAGTFSLAMAFAANDLVNFIGVPLAGLSSFQHSVTLPEPLTTTMTYLKEPYKANTLYLLVAGLIMVATLYVSKKSKSVTKTEVSLGSQEEEVERFQSFGFARGMVRSIITLVDAVVKVSPERSKEFVNKRFDRSLAPQPKNQHEKPPAFDLVRASVNLMVASALISLGTSLKLPLSTTYVTFIVAMSTALSDRAWGRDSAVYRVSGVLTVIGGWFITALFASALGALIASILWFGGIYAVFILLALCAFLLIRTNIFHTKREKDFADVEIRSLKSGASREDLYKNICSNSSIYFSMLNSLLIEMTNGIKEQSLKTLRNVKKDSKDSIKLSEAIISDLNKFMKLNSNTDLQHAKAYADMLGYMYDLSLIIRRLSVQSYDYFDNNHKKFTKDQNEDMLKVEKAIQDLLTYAAKSAESGQFDDELLVSKKRHMDEMVATAKMNQLTRHTKGITNNRQNLLFLNIVESCRKLSDAASKSSLIIGSNN